MAEQQEFITSVVNNFIGGICIFEIDSDSLSVTPVFLNDGLYRMMNGTKDIVGRMFKDIRRTMIPEDIPIFDQGIRNILADDGAAVVEFRIVGSDGSLVWLRLNGNLCTREGSKNTIAAVILDCTEEKLIEEELKRQSDYMHMLMDTDITFDFNCRTDVCVFKIAQANELERDRVIEKYIENINSTGIHEDFAVLYENMIKSAMAHAHRDSLEFMAQGIAGPSQEYRWYRANIISILGKEGYVSHVIGHITDIHEEKMKEIELKLRADHDGLTGLLNKKATEELIRKCLDKNKGNNAQGALIIIDTDDFKHINDNFGHSSGDKVLSLIGGVINDNFKGMDVAGRIGGDEFMVFLNSITPDDACKLAGKLQNNVQAACVGEAYEGRVSLSIGIATSPTHGSTFEELYEKADKALYNAKEAGKACWKIYS
ncbi:MAG: sensor domain-containing diguanylate cyclase [Lachnospiraceae bacterium]|nr:sensor domain-containing diguanylate cyclase [Lachnospiraceae bacterium]